MLRVICAWCRVLMKDGIEPTSHGICQSCEEDQARKHKLPEVCYICHGVIADGEPKTKSDDGQYMHSKHAPLL